MNALTLDTHQLFNNFKSAGFNEDQAEVQTKTAKLVLEISTQQIREEIKPCEVAKLSDVENLRSDMTKMEKGLRSDMTHMEHNLRSDMAKMEANIRADMHTLKNNILSWVFGMIASIIFAQTSLIFAFFGKALKLF